jgi:hypothetical protein
LLLPEPDQPEHTEGGSILPEGLPTMSDLQKLHGAAGTLNGFDLYFFLDRINKINKIFSPAARYPWAEGPSIRVIL